jgi:hypothetical protein
MKLKKMLLFAGLTFLMVQILFAGATAKDGSGVLNMIIKMEESPSAGGKDLDMNSSTNLLNEADSRKLNVTISVTGDAAHSLYPLYITMLGIKANHELAMGGMSNGEKLVSFEDADARLIKAKSYVESDYVCGGKQLKVAGYVPQVDSLNQSEYKILDDLGLSYMLDGTGLPESQGKAMPYLMNGSSFYVVPVSSSTNLPMWDMKAKEAAMNDTDWYNLLVSRFDESAAKGEPFVVVFTNTVSGSSPYLDAYKKFVEYAVSKGASFVTTKELVERSKT